MAVSSGLHLNGLCAFATPAVHIDINTTSFTSQNAGKKAQLFDIRHNSVPYKVSEIKPNYAASTVVYP